MALRVPVLLFLIVPSVLCRPSSIGTILDGASTIATLSVVPRNASLTDDLLAPYPASVLATTNDTNKVESGGLAEKDGASGAVISAASIGSVALVVVACGGCFFLGKRRKRPGFHMPTVLVDIESARDQPDSPSSSPTSVRPPWRDSVRKSMPPFESEGETNHERYPPNGASNSRPPSYASAKDPPYPPGPSSHSHEAP